MTRMFTGIAAIIVGVMGLFVAGCENDSSVIDELTRNDGVKQQVPEPPPDPGKVPPAPVAATGQGAANPFAARTGGGGDSGSFDDRVKKHGTDAVLRTKGHLKKAEQQLKLVKPNWQTPFPLSFKKLIANYRYFQVHQQFYEQGLPRIHGGAVELSGAVMPIDSPGNDGKLARFWLANPIVVMAGCVFCNPPTLGDLVYVEADPPLEVDREALYRSVVTTRLLGRLFIGPDQSKDGIEYLYRMQLKTVLE